MATRTNYAFKPWSRLTGDAQRVGEAIEDIRQQRGTISPAAVVEAARDQQSVLHPYFEWNDGTAANKYREQQAAHLLRSIVTVRTTGVELSSPARAFVSVRAAAEESEDESPGTYTSLAEAMRVVTYRHQLMRDALRDLDAYRIKYQLLADIAGWAEALEIARRNLETNLAAAQAAAKETLEERPLSAATRQVGAATHGDSVYE
jgi:hypothetical protein